MSSRLPTLRCGWMRTSSRWMPRCFGMRRSDCNCRRRRMPEPLVTLAFEGELALITLNRPEKLNSLTQDMMDALGEYAMRIEDDAGVRCAILTAAGDKAF